MSNKPEPGGHIFDTTCLNYFALTGQLHLLETRYGNQAYIPREVLSEIEDGIKNHPQLRKILGVGWLKILRLEEPEDLIDFERLLMRWGKEERNRGEAATIILAKRFGLVAVIDERVGRATAKEFGLEITGTLGIIARMVRESVLSEDEGWTIHQDMVSINPGGLRSPISDREQFSELCSGFAS